LSWIELKYSKKAVRRAGDYLISDELDIEKYFDSYEALDNWRSSHEYPIQSMLGYFRKKAFEVDSDAIVVRRLKRTPSILAKLRREGRMKLDRMEDIGGCRIVVTNKKQVYEVRDAIVDGRTRNTLRRKRDYIKQPKESGYRGIHLVYRYGGQKDQYSAHSIELQIRSKVQHAWATAVEYSRDHLAFATQEYAKLEKEYKENKKRDVVLVSAESVHGLKKAYPNYFADTTEFSKNIERIIEANKALQRVI